MMLAAQLAVSAVARRRQPPRPPWGRLSGDLSLPLALSGTAAVPLSPPRAAAMSAPAGSVGMTPGVSAPKDDDIPLLNNQA